MGRSQPERTDSPGQHLTRAGDPEQAIQDPLNPDPENEAITPFKMTTAFTIVNRSLPRLRFGAAYRFRVRAVDLAGQRAEGRRRRGGAAGAGR